MINPLAAGTHGALHFTTLGFGTHGLLGAAVEVAGVGRGADLIRRIQREDDEILEIIINSVISGILK
jgi:hypothetical protein